jgi:hypothetical protein
VVISILAVGNLSPSSTSDDSERYTRGSMVLLAASGWAFGFTRKSGSGNSGFQNWHLKFVQFFWYSTSWVPTKSGSAPELPELERARSRNGCRHAGKVGGFASSLLHQRAHPRGRLRDLTEGPTSGGWRDTRETDGESEEVAGPGAALCCYHGIDGIWGRCLSELQAVAADSLRSFIPV